MNREQARKNWEVIKAYGEGKELQYRKIGETEWHDERKHLGFCFDTDDCEFRIKPEEMSITFWPNESCYKCGKKLTIENMSSVILASNPPKYMCKKCAGEEPEENYTIEQICGENKVEGVVLSVSGSVSNELNEHCKWCKGKGCNCATCHNKDEENSYYLLHKDKFPEPKEKHYRQFNNCNELIEHFVAISGCINGVTFRPLIWVKHKEYGTEFLITAFDNYDNSENRIGEPCVMIQDMWVTMKELFEHYTFLNDSPIGKLEEK